MEGNQWQESVHGDMRQGRGEEEEAMVVGRGAEDPDGVLSGLW